SGPILPQSAMHTALITLLSYTILHLVVIINPRNTIIDAASAGPRHAALAARALADGKHRATQSLTTSIPNASTAYVTVNRETSGELITVTIDHQIPLLGFITGPIPLSATAHAYDLTP